MSQQQGRIGVTTYRTHRAQEAASRLRLRQRIEALEERLRRLEAARETGSGDTGSGARRRR